MLKLMLPIIAFSVLFTACSDASSSKPSVTWETVKDPEVKLNRAEWKEVGVTDVNIAVNWQKFLIDMDNGGYAWKNYAKWNKGGITDIAIAKEYMGVCGNRYAAIDIFKRGISVSSGLSMKKNGVHCVNMHKK